MRKLRDAKKRIGRQGMAILLAVVMIFSSVNISAFAQETEESVSKTEENTEEITTEMPLETIVETEIFLETEMAEEAEMTAEFQAANEVEKAVAEYENQGVYDYVSRMYETVLERFGDTAGIADWYGRLLDGRCNGADVAYGFFFSAEYTKKNKTDDEYVRDLYKALFDRGADETGYGVWMEQLQGGVPRINVLKGFVDSEEFANLCHRFGITKGTVEVEKDGQIYYYANGFVRRLYEVALNREADAEGVDFWKTKLVNKEISGAEAAYGFIFSSECREMNLNNEEFIQLLYQTLFDRAADESGTSTWTEYLEAGVSREYVFKGFIDSGEFECLCGEYGIDRGTIDMEENGDAIYYSDQFVRQLYQEALKREAEPEGLESWKSKLISKEASGAEVAYGFIFSNECSGQNLNNEGFVDLLYQSLFGREADEEGRNIWINQLNNGMKREYVFADFVNSKEFEALCNKYGIEKGKWSRRKIDPSKPMVALTFDYGPSIYRPTILNCLEEYGQSATFFVVGSNAAKYGDYMKRAYDLGCEIGNHTYNHPDLTYLSSWAISSEINQTNQYIRQAIGIDATVARTPGGSYNSTVCSAIPTPIIMWSIDTLDWKTRDTYSTVNAVLNNVQDGDIVLMHDIHSPTIAAAEILIPELVRRGYQLVTVSELAEYRGDGMQAGSVYFSFK